MNKIRNPRNMISIVLVLLLTSFIYAQQKGSEANTNSPNQAAKTRTDLLNELSLRDALVVLETAKEAHDRYESEYRDAERLIKQNIIAQKDLDEAWSRYNQALQALKKAENQLDRTKLSFLANATHITILEAKSALPDQNLT